MLSQSCTDCHIFSVSFKKTSVIFRKQLHLRGNHASNPRNADDSSMKVSCQRQIRSPCCIGIKIHRIVRHQNMKMLLIRSSELLLQVLPFIGRLPKLVIILQRCFHVQAHMPHLTGSEPPWKSAVQHTLRTDAHISQAAGASVIHDFHCSK